MMYFVMKFILLLPLLSASKAWYIELPTITSKDQYTYVIKEGESLEFTCIESNSENLRVIYPETDFESRTETSPRELIIQQVNATSTVRKFRRNSTVYGDTGYYGCADLHYTGMFRYNGNLDVSQNITFKGNIPNVSYIFYVYVTSKNESHVFTEEGSVRILYKSSFQEKLLVPCRPTNPDANVTILETTDSSIGAINTWNEFSVDAYSPERGFFIKSRQCANFSCAVTVPSGSFLIDYDLKELPKNPGFSEIYVLTKDSETKIILIGQSFVKIGSRVEIQCRIDYLNWSSLIVKLRMPFKNEENKYLPYTIESYGGTNSRAYYKFEIENFDYSHVGMYVCTFIADDNFYKREIYLGGYEDKLRVYDGISRDAFHSIGLESFSELFNMDTLECDSEHTNDYSNFNFTALRKKTTLLLWFDEEPLKFLDEVDAAKDRFGATAKDPASIKRRTRKKINNSMKIVCNMKDVRDIKMAYLSNAIVKNRVPLEFTETNLKNSVTYYEDSVVNVNLTCFVDGDPEPIISWYKNGNLLNNSNLDSETLFNYTDGQILLVKSLPVSEEHVNYSCKAVNEFDEIEAFQGLYWLQFTDTSDVFLTSILVLLGLILPWIFITCIVIFFKWRERKILDNYLQEAGLELNSSVSFNSEEMVHNQVDRLPYDKKWEFNLKRLKLGDKLGSGAFGVVMKAEAHGIRSDEEVTVVAVKMVHPYADLTQIRALASELKVMIYVGKHLNILNLLGACTSNISKRELFVIVEYCEHGNLRDYLLTSRDNFIDQTNVTVDESTHLTSTFDTQDLISWSYQVARGMEYLSQKKILHGDLAARNILLTEGKIVKVCDFGLSKMLYEESYYKKNSQGLLPLKWMSIESIRDRVFSSQSDVWSYGIVLWEFFSLAEVPYCDVRSDKLLGKLLDGYRLKKPTYASQDVYQLMRDCWNDDPTSRPTFTNLVKKMNRMIEASANSNYTDLSAVYESIDNVEL